MSRYSIGFPGPIVEKHFFKELSKLQKPIITQIKKAIESLADDPRPQGSRPSRNIGKPQSLPNGEGKKFKFLRPPVSIAHLVATHRLRIRDYRILYDVDDKSKRVILLAIRRRSEKAYR